MTRFQPRLAVAAAACGAALLGYSLAGIVSVDRTLQAAATEPAIHQERSVVVEFHYHHWHGL